MSTKTVTARIEEIADQVGALALEIGDADLQAMQWDLLHHAAELGDDADRTRIGEKLRLQAEALQRQADALRARLRPRLVPPEDGGAA